MSSTCCFTLQSRLIVAAYQRHGWAIITSHSLSWWQVHRWHYLPPVAQSTNRDSWLCGAKFVRLVYFLRMWTCLTSNYSSWLGSELHTAWVIIIWNTTFCWSAKKGLINFLWTPIWMSSKLFFKNLRNKNQICFYLSSFGSGKRSFRLPCVAESRNM